LRTSGIGIGIGSAMSMSAGKGVPFASGVDSSRICCSGLGDVSVIFDGFRGVGAICLD
jgi:hypothetical protein